jgi:uncharacterized alkaline shock family protein YloU
MTQPGKSFIDIEVVIADRVVAAVAADAALRVPGVRRLEVGVTGLLTQLGRAAVDRIGGPTVSVCDGIRATVTGQAVRITADLATTGAPATSVARAVQHAIAAQVQAATGLTVTEVAVTVLDIDPTSCGGWATSAPRGTP